jgi:hypothetical protein
MKFLSLKSYSQSYTYKKTFVLTPGMPSDFFRLKGEVFVSDTLISITTQGVKNASNYSVKVISQNGIFKQYRLANEMKEGDYRFSFNENMIDKGAEFTLNVEVKDNFTQKISTVTYFLIPNQ